MTTITKINSDDRYTHMEVNRVIEVRHDGESEVQLFEPGTRYPENGHGDPFWSVYGRDAETGHAECLGDFKTEQAAVSTARKLAAMRDEACSEPDLIDSAMCLWEEVLDCMSDGRASWADHMQKISGMAVVRQHVQSLARPCHMGWIAAHNDGNGFDAPFDWEFVPWFIRNCIDRDGCLLPGHIQIATNMGRKAFAESVQKETA